MSQMINVRAEFNLTPDYIHLSNGLISPHPRIVRQQINFYRQELDSNPALYIKNHSKHIAQVLSAAAAYFNTSHDLIALTESTTMGLTILYHGFQLSNKDEIISTTHDHYATQEILRFKCKMSGAQLKTISLYDDVTSVNDDEIIQRLMIQITVNTRLIALTWVHSCTGVKIPIAKIANAIKEINVQRKNCDHILISVDGVHALGIEDFNIEELGCDFFVAGCHKSFFGPRGTGFIWETEKAWQKIEPLFPSSDDEVFLPWLRNLPPTQTISGARLCAPGGFIAFEHRWSLKEAFDFHLHIGKAQINQYIEDLNTKCKHAMSAMQKIKLHTPLNPQLSSGMICFEIAGKTPTEIIQSLYARKIIAGLTPYPISYVRFMPGLCNSPEDIDIALNALREIT